MKILKQKLKLYRDLLAKEKISSHNYHSILLAIFTARGLKPVSSIGVNRKKLKKFNAYFNQLGLIGKRYPANPQGYHEIIISTNKKKYPPIS